MTDEDLAVMLRTSTTTIHKHLAAARATGDWSRVPPPSTRRPGRKTLWWRPSVEAWFAVTECEAQLDSLASRVAS